VAAASFLYYVVPSLATTFPSLRNQGMAKHPSSTTINFLHPPKNQILKKKIKLNLEINIINRSGKKIITPSPSPGKYKEKKI
jgi:hypothetical protein